MPNFTPEEAHALIRTDFTPVHYTVDIRGHRARLVDGSGYDPPFEPFVKPDFCRLVATDATNPDRPLRHTAEVYGNDMLAAARMFDYLAVQLRARHEQSLNVSPSFGV